jgi:hypothetical protein
MAQDLMPFQSSKQLTLKEFIKELAEKTMVDKKALMQQLAVRLDGDAITFGLTGE